MLDDIDFSFLDEDKDKLDDIKSINFDEDKKQAPELIETDEEDKTTSDIIKMDENIDNIDLFKKHMLSKGYVSESNRFLVKNFAESKDPDSVYNVNITINHEKVTAITAYDQKNKVVNIPSAIIKQVKNDIEESLSTYI